MKDKSFSNVQFEFEDFDENEKIKQFDIKDDEIKDVKNYFNFSNKSIFQKSEIKFNNFLNEKLDTQKLNKQKKIYAPVIGCTGNNSFVWDKKKNKLFLFGHNDVGQLGNDHFGYEVDIDTLTYDFILFNKLNFSKIKKVSLSDFHSLILFENNDLYSRGWNYSGACGFSMFNVFVNENKPNKIEFFKDKKIKDIFCSHENSYVLLENNFLYGFGNNEHGMLGIGKKKEHSFEPLKISFFDGDKELKDIFVPSDGNRCFFLTKNNIVYVIGKGLYQELDDFDNFDDAFIPKEIESLKNKNIEKIFPGTAHTFFLDENGGLFSCGKNSSGECGLEYSTFITKFEQIKFFKKKGEEIQKISLGDGFTIFLTKSSKVYCCGENFHGELGIGKNLEKSIKIEEIEFFKDKNIIDIFSGYHHSLAISKDGNIYAWGRNNYGQLGLGTLKKQIVPVQIYKIE